MHPSSGMYALTRIEFWKMNKNKVVNYDHWGCGARYCNSAHEPPPVILSEAWEMLKCVVA